MQLTHVSFRYRRGAEALRDVSIAIEPGEFVALAGRSGSGKSTLAQVMKGLLTPQEGRVEVNPDEVGLVFQFPEHQLFATTVFDDVAFGPRHALGPDPAAVEARVRTAIAAVGLDFERFRSRSPFDLSGGEKRRVAIAGVLALEPRVLILDEPTAGVDGRAKNALFDLLHRLNREQGITIVMISHRLEEVLAHANRLLIMDQGRLVADGRPVDLLSDAGLLGALDLEMPDCLALRRRLAEVGVAPVERPWDPGAVAAALEGRLKR